MNRYICNLEATKEWLALDSLDYIVECLVVRQGNFVWWLDPGAEGQRGGGAEGKELV